MFVLSFTISDVQYDQETSGYTFSSHKTEKSVMFCWQRIQGKFFSLGKKINTVSCITAAMLSWSLNNHGLLRGFIVGSGVGISFSLVVVSALPYERDNP